MRTPLLRTSLLVVDGDDGVREALAKLLAQAGYDVDTATDTREAAALLDPARTGLLILDLDLPYKHAAEAFSPLTSLNAGVPILLLTNQPDDYPAALMPDVGALLEKPVEVELLLRTIDDLLSGPRELCLHGLCACRHDTWHNPAGRPSPTPRITLPIFR